MEKSSNDLLVVADTLINKDMDGRYCLNDLHRAAGLEDRHKPANFIRLDSTEALIMEIDRCSDLSNGPIKVLQGGINQGTYVVKELVYAYAMWISPAFHIKVIRAYDAMVTEALTGQRQSRPKAPAKERDFIDRKLELVVAYDKTPTALSRQSIYEALEKLHEVHGEKMSDECKALHREAIWDEPLALAGAPQGAWIPVLSQVIDDIHRGRYAHPHVFETFKRAGETLSCLLIRPGHIMDHLEHGPTESKRTHVPLLSARQLRQHLLSSGVVVRDEVDRVIDGRRVAHLMALSVMRLADAGVTGL